MSEQANSSNQDRSSLISRLSQRLAAQENSELRKPEPQVSAPCATGASCNPDDENYDPQAVISDFADNRESRFTAADQELKSAVNQLFEKSQGQNGAPSSSDSEAFVYKPIANENFQPDDTALQECYHRNMSAFFKYEPNIYKQFCSYRPKTSFEIRYTKSGAPDVFFNNNNEFFYKSDDPIDLCKRQVEVTLRDCPFTNVYYNLNKDVFGQIHHRYMAEMRDFQEDLIPADSTPLLAHSCPIAIILGSGLGYHIGKLYEDIEIGNLIIIEPNTDLFFASLYTFDWASLLEFVVKENRGLYLMVGHNKDDVYDSLNEFFARHGVMLSGFIWTMVHYRSEAINEIAAQLKVDYERNFTSMGFFDDGVFSISHGSYLFTHHARFMRKDVQFADQILNTPLCVVANGPSLSNDLPFLRKLQDKVLILACGSAIETLYNAGIQPFFYAATERLKVVAESLSLIPDQDYVQSTVLIAPDVCHPDTFKMFKHTACILKADEVFFQLAGMRFVDRLKNIQAACMINPLVGNLGVVVGASMHFKNIYLFGMDNGTKFTDLLHPQESILYKNKVVEDNSNVEPVELDKFGKARPSMFELKYEFPGNFGGQVRSSYLYKVARRYMELTISTHGRNSNYFNCSDGALIEGAKPVHSADLFEEWSKLPDIDRDALLKFVDEEKTIELNFTEQDMIDMCDYAAMDHLIDNVKRMLTNKNRPKSRLEFVFLFENVCELMSIFMGSYRHRFTVNMLHGSINQFFMMTIRVLYFTEDEQEALRRAERQISWILDFLDDAKRIYHFCPYYYGEEHFKFLDGKVGFDHPDSKAPPLPERKPLVTQADRDKYPVRKFVKRYE